ncbi:MAG: bile acid:sodium symporter family protein [Candidatus Glassbacteria bacterium]|nr:bile acid:sodium symporter family protein [Candidatus Glassbacteria bacterium]
MRAIKTINAMFPVWVIAGCTLAYCQPGVFGGWVSEQVTLFFGLAMFGIGATLQLDDAADTLRRWDKIALGSLAQFTIMPLAAYGLTRLIETRPELALGLVLTGCVPGAMSSNVLAYIARGNVAYSVALTTVSTFLSPWITPALTLVLLGNVVHIPYAGMMLTIIKAVLLPLAGGIVFRRLAGRRIESFIELFPTLSIFAIVVICAVVVARNVELIREASLVILLLVVLLNALGMAGGWWFGRLIRLREAEKRTLAIEIGMQNAGMGTVLALTHFSHMPGVALPSAIFTVWCIVSASLFSLTAYRGAQ